MAKNWNFRYLEGCIVPLTPLNLQCLSAFMFLVACTQLQPALSVSLLVGHA